MKPFLLWILFFLAAEAVLTILRYALWKRGRLPAVQDHSRILRAFRRV